MGDVARYTCSCGQLIAECRFWHEVAKRCRERGMPFSVGAFGTSLRSVASVTDILLRARVRGRIFERGRAQLLRHLPGVREEAAGLIRRNFELSQVVCSVQDRDLFVDGSKDAPRLVHFIGAGLWDVRTIFLTRDGRGVVNSFMTRRQFDIQTAVSRWMRTVTEDIRAKDRAGRNVLTIKYEDLCRDPRATLSSIWRWLEIEDVSLGRNFRAGDFHILGNDMRLAQFTEIRLDERWRTRLGEADLRYFDREAGEVNRALGYD
jgi:hypothetical protein